MVASNRILSAGFACLVLSVTALPSQGGLYTFSNTNLITMSENTVSPLTAASPYPSAITVSGLTGQVITHVTVTLNGFSHTFPSDASLLLVGPGGQMATLMSEAGGQDLVDSGVTNLTITFDDNSFYPLPILDGLFSGVFEPGALTLPLPFSFPSPAPAGNANAPAALSVFQNTDPDGVWALYIVDDSVEDFGSLSGGWSLQFSVGVPLQIKPAGSNIVFSWPVVSGQTFALQYSTNLYNSNGWSGAPGVLTQVGGRDVVTNLNTNALNRMRYYRLLQQ
jgi:subtilisin-like proprotein convertase family protein